METGLMGLDGLSGEDDPAVPELHPVRSAMRRIVKMQRLRTTIRSGRRIALEAMTTALDITVDLQYMRDSLMWTAS